MKKFSKVIAIALLACTVAGTMAGCGGKKEPAVDKNNNVVNGTFEEFLVVEKVGTVGRDDFMTTEGGLYYKDDKGKYGVMSYEGLYDTGAKYSYVENNGKYFQAAWNLADNYVDYNGLNTVMLLNGKGETIIAGIYADYKILNDRYVQAIKVKNFTSEEKALVKYTSSSTIAEIDTENDVYYDGEWYVYDIIDGNIVPGARGTNNEVVYARGMYVTYTDDKGVQHTVNNKGEALPEDAVLFDDGSYRLEGKIGEVYAGDGTKLLGYDLTGFVPYDIAGDYYIAKKSMDGVTKYAMMDKAGLIVSSEFEDSIDVAGELVLCQNKIYNFKGENVLEGEYDSIESDRILGDTYLVRSDDYYTMIDVEGNVFFNGPFDDDHSVFTDNFVASEKKEGDYYFYSHKDQDYTIKGYTFSSPWLVTTDNANNLYNLVDTMNGATLLEGYSSYSSTSRSATSYYIYAKYNGGADVYLVTPASQIVDVAEKKENLFDDLIAAFTAEGLNVSVNKETGEIALDAAVLFGGDSAVLTDEGKTFLNKFIKVYTTVGFSEKYAGFITKTMVEGHTAPIQGSTYASGMPLSEERAAVVKNYCLSSETNVDVSVIADSLEDVGYSNSQPIYNADGSVNLDACRRVSFRFLVNVDDV